MSRAKCSHEPDWFATTSERRVSRMCLRMCRLVQVSHPVGCVVLVLVHVFVAADGLWSGACGVFVRVWCLVYWVCTEVRSRKRFAERVV